MNAVLKNHPLAQELIMLLPNVAILVGKLAMDKRISMETKVTLGAAALYLVSPIDGIPDFIPVLGQLDDIVMVLLIVDGVVNHVDPEIVREHWRGGTATLERIQSIARTLTSFVPGFLKDKFFERATTSRAAKPFRALTRMAGDRSTSATEPTASVGSGTGQY